MRINDRVCDNYSFSFALISFRLSRSKEIRKRERRNRIEEGRHIHEVNIRQVFRGRIKPRRRLVAFWRLEFIRDDEWLVKSKSWSNLTDISQYLMNNDSFTTVSFSFFFLISLHSPILCSFGLDGIFNDRIRSNRNASKWKFPFRREKRIKAIARTWATILVFQEIPRRSNINQIDPPKQEISWSRAYISCQAAVSEDIYNNRAWWTAANSFLSFAPEGEGVKRQTLPDRETERQRNEGCTYDLD